MITNFEQFVNNNGNVNEAYTYDSNKIFFAGNAIEAELMKFLDDVVIPKSKGHVKFKHDAALFLVDILKDKLEYGHFPTRK